MLKSWGSHRDIARQLAKVCRPQRKALDDLLARTDRILTQQRKDKIKLCALHSPEVECIAKGKARAPYKFSVQVLTVTTSKEWPVVGARFVPGNFYDGHVPRGAGTG